MRKTRILGQGLEVSAIGLGCMGMDHAYGAPADREESAWWGLFSENGAPCP